MRLTFAKKAYLLQLLRKTKPLDGKEGLHESLLHDLMVDCEKKGLQWRHLKMRKERIARERLIAESLIRNA